MTIDFGQARRAARIGLALVVCCVVSACVAPRPAPSPSPASVVSAGKLPWEQRRVALVRAASWQMEGRTAVALGEQGWQANLGWQQHDKNSEVHLSGPLGVGAVVLRLTPEGLSIEGGAKSGAKGAAALQELQDRLGFELPLAHLRYWVLGVPDPALAAQSIPNDQDRLLQLTQDGWTVDYARYTPVDADVLPAKLVLARDTVRVRVLVDRWTLQP